MFVESISYINRISGYFFRVRRIEVIVLLLFDLRAIMLLISSHGFLFFFNISQVKIVLLSTSTCEATNFVSINFVLRDVTRRI